MELTIEDLATKAGARTSTVRMYQSKGLLDPPQVRGRVGYYTDAHLDRLRAIARLQDRGYSLAAIKELFDSWAAGATLDDLLGAGGRREPTPLGLADFAALFPDGDIDPDIVRRAVELGLVAMADDQSGLRVPSPTFLEVGRALAELGVPPSVSLDEYELLAADVRRIAGRYVALFERALLGDDPPAVAPERLTELGAAIARFRALAREAVSEALDHALDEAAADAASRHLGARKP